MPAAIATCEDKAALIGTLEVDPSPTPGQCIRQQREQSTQGIIDRVVPVVSIGM